MESKDIDPDKKHEHIEHALDRAPRKPREKDKVKCDECGHYVSKKYLVVHKNITHRGHRAFACKVSNCEERFSTTFKLADHKRAAHDFAKLRCNVEGCGLEFLMRPELVSHTRRNHQIECGVAGCDKSFHDKYRLMNHMRLVHSFSKLKCNFEDCSAEFTSDQGLACHKKKHMK